MADNFLIARSLLFAIISLASVKCSPLEPLYDKYEKVRDPYNELIISEIIEETKFRTCFPVMCKIDPQDYLLYTLHGMSIDDIVYLNVCSQILIKAEDQFGNINLLILKRAEILQSIQKLLKRDKSLELILLVNYPITISSTSNFLHPEKELQLMKQAVFPLMRDFNFTGLHLTLTDVVSNDTKSLGRFRNSLQPTVQKFKQICDDSAWTLDATIMARLHSFVDNGLIENIKMFTRYLVLANDWMRNPADLLPFSHKDSSFERLMILRNRHTFQMQNIFVEIPLHAMAFRYKEDIFKKKAGIVNPSQDALTDVKNLLGLWEQNYATICKSALEDESNSSFYRVGSAGSVFLHNPTNNQFVSMETARSLFNKVQYLIEHGIGGFSFTKVLADDDSGLGCGVQFPLLKTVSYAIGYSNKCRTTTSSDNPLTPINNSKLEISNITLYVVSIFSSFAAIVTWIVLASIYRRKIFGGIFGRANNFPVKKSPTEYLSALEVPEHEYQIYADSVLGSGNFSLVLKGKILSEDVAVKIPKRNTRLKQSVAQQYMEIEILRTVNGHPNIVDLLGISTKSVDSGYIYQFLEFCPLGSLDTFLKQNRQSFINFGEEDGGKSATDDLTGLSFVLANCQQRFDINNLIFWTCQICEGMEHVSSKNIYHGDLAARNVLLLSLDCIKICDFGLAKAICSVDVRKPIAKHHPNKSCSSYPWRWMAPEFLESHTIHQNSDVWSFGVTAWEIFSLGEIPYGGLECSSELLSVLKSGAQLPQPRCATTQIHQTLITSCWTLNPNERPNFEAMKIKFKCFLRTQISEESEECCELIPELKE